MLQLRNGFENLVSESTEHCSGEDGNPEPEGFGFLTAAPAIDSWALEIREVRSEGALNSHLAINHSAYYLLTDMDLLMGSKQSRVVNTSLLLLA